MLDKCANSLCPAIFRTLRDGKVFVTETEAIHQSRVSDHGRQRQYFWLCTSCCRTMTVMVEKGKSAQVVPLQHSATAARTDS